VDQFRFAVTVEVRPNDMVRGREFVDLFDLPRLARLLMTSEPDNSLTAGGLHGERTFKCDLRNAVAVDISHCLIHDLRPLRNDDVPFPARIFVPGDFLYLQRVGDNVRLAVVIEVGNRYGIPTAEVGIDVMRLKLDGARNRDGNPVAD